MSRDVWAKALIHVCGALRTSLVYKTTDGEVVTFVQDRAENLRLGRPLDYTRVTVKPLERSAPDQHKGGEVQP